MTHIVSIVYQPEDQVYEDGRFHTFIRVPQETAELVADHGIKGDRKAGRNPRRQLNLLSTEWLAVKQGEGYKTEPGQFGEQLIVDGLAMESLDIGTQLQLGDQARIEISMPRIGCTRLEAAQGVDGLAGTHIGVLARVITGGTIYAGDPVCLVSVQK